MREECNDVVGVLAVFTSTSRGGVRVVPQALHWQGKRWLIDKMGLYHPERRGTKRIHIFGFSSGNTAFRVELDPETLIWTLREVFYGA